MSDNQAPAGDGQPENDSVQPDASLMEAKLKRAVSEKKEETRKRQELEARLAEFEARAEADAEEKAKANGEYEALKAKALAERDAALAKYEAERIGNALTEALVRANVSPPLMEAAKALMRSQGAKLDKNDQPVLGETPLADAVREWAESDAGSAFVKAPESTGGGAPGGGSNRVTADDFKSMSLDRRAALMREKPDLYRNLAGH